MSEKVKVLLKQEGAKLSGAKVYYRDSWECDYFDIAGKFFALL